ncbi:MAG: hypothetical protein QM723_39795 [Myxococcaceae bacterium]
MARRPLKVKHNQRERDGKLKLIFGLLRFGIYGFVGIAAEVFFYTAVKVGRDIPLVKYLFMFDWCVDDQLKLDHIKVIEAKTLFGQCSLWMFPVYAGACMLCVEPVYRKLASRPWFVRAVLYGLGILAFECISGWVLYWVTGYKIWYYADKGNIAGMTSWFILPIWCATGVLIERIYRELIDPKVAEELEKLDAAAATG